MNTFISRTMPMSLRIPSVLLVLIATQSACFARAPVPKPKGIGADTVAAYEKLGATYGSMVRDSTGLIHFEEPKDGVRPAGMPAFRFFQFPGGDLPDVGVPFALAFWYGELNDTALKEIKALKNLSQLTFNGPVTDEGIAHLAELGGLNALSINGAKITNAGLKSLGRLKTLESLSLSNAKGVTDGGFRELVGLEKLRVLFIGSASISDSILIEIKPLVGLVTLACRIAKSRTPH